MRQIVLMLMVVCWLIGCEEKSAEVGGTCASMGGVECTCPDGTTSCTTAIDPSCKCLSPAGDDPRPPIESEGGTCDSLGGEPCECPDGTRTCTDHTGRCLCEALLIPTSPVEKGGDCSSLGGEPCVCEDGSKACTNHKGDCLCAGGQAGAIEPNLVDDPKTPTLR